MNIDDNYLSERGWRTFRYWRSQRMSFVFEYCRFKRTLFLSWNVSYVLLVENATETPSVSLYLIATFFVDLLSVFKVAKFLGVISGVYFILTKA